MSRAAILGCLTPAAALLALAGCGGPDEEERAQRAAAALTDYYYAGWQPPGPEWTVMRVRVGKDNAVTVDATVSSEALTRTIMGRSRFEQMEIARMACPAIAAKVWADVASKQPIGVALSGSAGYIINAQCKRP